MSFKVFELEKGGLEFDKAFKTSRKCPVPCKFFGVVISPLSAGALYWSL